MQVIVLYAVFLIHTERVQLAAQTQQQAGRREEQPSLSQQSVLIISPLVHNNMLLQTAASRPAPVLPRGGAGWRGWGRSCGRWWVRQGAAARFRDWSWHSIFLPIQNYLKNDFLENSKQAWFAIAISFL